MVSDVLKDCEQKWIAQDKPAYVEPVVDATVVVAGDSPMEVDEEGYGTPPPTGVTSTDSPVEGSENRETSTENTTECSAGETRLQSESGGDADEDLEV